MMQSHGKESGLIVYGGDREGKAPHLSALAGYFGKNHTVTDWQPGTPVPDDTIVFTIERQPSGIHYIDALFCAGTALQHDTPVRPARAGAAPADKQPVGALSVEKLKASLRNCVAGALVDEPHSIDTRAHSFVARLAGALENHDKELSDLVFGVLLKAEAVPA